MVSIICGEFVYWQVLVLDLGRHLAPLHSEPFQLAVLLGDNLIVVGLLLGQLSLVPDLLLLVSGLELEQIALFFSIQPVLIVQCLA